MIWEKCHIWWKSQILRKGQIWQKDQNWQKYQFWRESQMWEKYQIWEKSKISDRSNTSHSASYSLDFVSHFCWTEKKLCETKRKKIWLWNRNSCDLKAKLATWGENFVWNAAGGSQSQQIFTIHIFNKSICHIYTIMP